MGELRKKRGRSRKRDPILVMLGDCPKKWNDYLLKTFGLPEVPQPRDEVQEAAFANEDGSPTPLGDVAGRQIRIGEEPPKGLGKVWAEHSFLENEPNGQWKRSQAFMRVMTRIYASKNRLSEQQRSELLKHVNELQPNESLPVFDECLGNPEDFLERWRGHELDVRFVLKSRATQMFEIWWESMPPDEPEDLDDAGEPSGHWEGLKWVPDNEAGGS